MIRTTPELLAALAASRSARVLELEGGPFAPLNLSKWTGAPAFDGEVVITSRDSANPATFPAFNMQDGRNVTLQGFRFDYGWKPGDVYYTRPFTFANMENLKVVGCTFDGDNDGGSDPALKGFPQAIGLRIERSRNVVVDGNMLKGFFCAAEFDRNVGLRETNNEIWDMRGGGLRHGENQNVLIEANHIHDFRRSAADGSHPDGIQFWTVENVAPSTDITIRGNVLDIGSGAWFQSIFMRNERVDMGMASFEAMAYRNLLIEWNIIKGAHLHGITVGETIGLTVRNNDLRQKLGGLNPDTARYGELIAKPRINVLSKSRDVRIEGNVTEAVIIDETLGKVPPTDWVVVGNKRPDGAALPNHGSTPAPMPTPEPPPVATPEPAPNPALQPAPGPVTEERMNAIEERLAAAEARVKRLYSAFGAAFDKLG
jgi:hypothetical protein